MKADNSPKVAQQSQGPKPDLSAIPAAPGSLPVPLQSSARRLPRDVGWLLMAGGVVGFVAPGILGLDMLALGALIVWPGNAGRIAGWLDDETKSPRWMRGSMRQVNRFLDNLERRYPGRRPG